MADNSESAIFETIRQATVVLTGLNEKDERTPIGSGFFVASGLLLSCAHVVAPARELLVEWQGQELPATVERCEPAVAGPNERFDSPDVALLRVDVDTPCVPLSRTGPQIGHRAWAPGITEIRTLEPEAYAAWLTVADLDNAIGLFRLTGDKVGQGMSGGPVLDVSTFEVCGTFKAELDNIGWAVPLEASLSVLDEPIFEENLKAHPDSLPALRMHQQAFEPHAQLVSNKLKGEASAQAQLRVELQSRGLHPELVAERAFPEWAARQLFKLNLRDLEKVLRALLPMVTKEQLVTISMVIACCHKGRDGSETWISDSASGALSKEFAEPAPRAVRMAAGKIESAEAMLRRAFLDFVVKPISGDPVSADPEHDTARDLEATYFWLAGYRNQSEWKEWDSPANRERDRENLLARRRFVLIGVESVQGDAWFRELAEKFRGFPLMFRGHNFTPSEPDDLILDLQPPVDRFLERQFTSFFSDLTDDKLGTGTP